MVDYPVQVSLVNTGFETTGGWTGTGVIGFHTAYTNESGIQVLPANGSQFLVLNNEALVDPSTTELRAYQTVAVPSGSYSDVDAGLLSATVRCNWTYVGSGTSRAWLGLSFYDIADALISTYEGADFDIFGFGPDYPYDDIGYYNVWRDQAYTHTVPANTRSIRVTLGGLDNAPTGDVCGVFYDDIELELYKPASIKIVVEQTYAEFIGVFTSVAQVSQVYTEALIVSPGDARAVQLYTEALLASPSDVQAACVYTEVLAVVSSSIHASQVYAELIRNVPAAPGGGGLGVIVCIMM